MKKNVIWKILIYFIIYSIIGFLLETVYAIFTKGMLESRQSFLYGPFCIVYGIGAIALIFSLNKYKENNFKLFVGGMIVGAFVEYFSSYFAEMIMHVKWWDYSNDFLNIHGRTCLYYAVCWGILSIPLIKYINPFFDKYINIFTERISPQIMKFSVLIIIVFMAIDGIISCYAIDKFLARVENEYNIDIKGIETNNNIAITENQNVVKLLKVTNVQNEENSFEEYFSNKKMMMIYPNMLVVNENDEVVYLDTLLGIKNYYYKLGK